MRPGRAWSIRYSRGDWDPALGADHWRKLKSLYTMAYGKRDQRRQRAGLFLVAVETGGRTCA